MTPGGFGVVFSDGIGRGQLLAALKGRPGERYIFCDAHVTVAEFARTAVDVAGRGRVPPTVPVGVRAQSPSAGRRCRASSAGRRCSRAASCTSSSGMPRRARTRRSASWAGARPTCATAMRRTLEAHGMLDD